MFMGGASPQRPNE